MSQHALIRSHLLDCLACPPGMLPVMPAFDPDDWQTWLRLATMHRVGPLLQWKQSQASCQQWPALILEALNRSRRQHALRALQMQRELLHAHRLLQSAGIPCMALKGAYLAWHAYPNADLRPIRDLDMLVPAEQALRAYEILLAGGFKLPQEHGELDAILMSSKHLPGIQRPGCSIKLELHAQLFHPVADGEHTHELSRLPGFWTRAIQRELAGQQIFYPAPTDQLLHLLVHAIADHKLNNGPLIFTDVYFLLMSHEIDWPLFWNQAEVLQQLRAITLGLQLVRYHWGDLPIGWPATLPAPEDASLLRKLRDFSLRNFDATKDVSVANIIQAGWPQRLSLLRKHILPSAHELAVRYPTGKKRRGLPYWYARKWLDSFKRLPSVLRIQRQQAIRAESDTLRELDAWLAITPEQNSSGHTHS